MTRSMIRSGRYSPMVAVPDDAAEVSLTTTSYLVLGLVSLTEPVTSYGLKQLVSRSVGYFWPFPHSQLYAEPARLAAAGLLGESIESTGRRRREYRLTEAGRVALRQWLAEPTTAETEIRDTGILKLFFGSASSPTDVKALAREQARAHRAKLAEYDALYDSIVGHGEKHTMATLELGRRFERTAMAFWSEVAQDLDGVVDTPSRTPRG